MDIVKRVIAGGSYEDDKKRGHGDNLIQSSTSAIWLSDQHEITSAIYLALRDSCNLYFQQVPLRLFTISQVNADNAIHKEIINV